MVGRVSKGSAMTDEYFNPVMVVSRQCRHGLQQVSGYPLAGLQPYEIR